MRTHYYIAKSLSRVVPVLETEFFFAMDASHISRDLQFTQE